MSKRSKSDPTFVTDGLQAPATAAYYSRPAVICSSFCSTGCPRRASAPTLLQRSCHQLLQVRLHSCRHSVLLCCWCVAVALHVSTCWLRPKRCPQRSAERPAAPGCIASCCPASHSSTAAALPHTYRLLQPCLTLIDCCSPALHLSTAAALPHTYRHLLPCLTLINCCLHCLLQPQAGCLTRIHCCHAN
jgi:hypothetical protein